MVLIFYCESLHKLYLFSIHGEHWSLALEVAVKKRFSNICAMLFCNLNFIKIPPSLFANLSELTAFSLVMANVLVITYALGNNGNRKKYLKYEFREHQKLKNEKTYLFYCT